MKLSVVGVGYVGLVVAAGFADGGNHVICVDKDRARIDKLRNGQVPLYEPGLQEILQRNKAAGRLVFTTDLKYAVQNSAIIFLAVGTPPNSDGSADISAVLEVAEGIAQCMDGYKIIVTKSTVPVGTAKKVSELIAGKIKQPFDYVSNPEFLKEGSALEDFLKPDRVIIGTTNPQVAEVMKQLYSPFMRKGSRMILMDPASAEMTKYAANVMLATRISFMNQLSWLCEKVGADIEKVRLGIGSDHRIGNAFLFAGVGYGGSCFPKDVGAFIRMGAEQAVPMSIAEAVEQANRAQQQRFAEKVLAYFRARRGGQVTLAVWGLAFKARTDDVRESPAIYCIEKFLAAGIKIKAFDPAVPTSRGSAALEALAGRIQIAQDCYEVLQACDGLVIFTDWQEFRTPDFELMAKKLKQPVIFDGRNLYEPSYVREQGFEYYAIGRC
jgi:UDPglucose 6-dehydrogenase